jgi:hypothetical protein
MLERQDIDALLIGALYGELTPADEARLQTHLESHPADKSALADLTSAREAVRESRFLTVQLEPPQAVSALLLQEASRHAPARAVAKEAPRESWFARFVAAFARNPSWAAAAMVVVVVGVAGTMYLRSGKSQLADHATTSSEHAERGPAAPAPSTDTPAANIAEEAKQLELQAGSSFGATLADPGAPPVAEPAPTDRWKDSAAGAKKEDAENERANKNKVAAKPPTTRTYIGVETAAPPKPMELDGYRYEDRKGGVAVGGAVRPDSVPRNQDPAVVTTPAPPPRAPAQTAPRGATSGAGGAPGAGDDQRRDKIAENKLADNEEAVWAREQHTKVTNAVRANNCRDATSLAVKLSNRAPAYYTQHVENDRALKQCMTYINAEREKEADRQQRARALQKRNSDEATDRTKDVKRPAAPRPNSNTDSTK